MDKLLTIAIPTYNRKEFLEEGLSVLLSQVEEYKDMVEIIVSDNASTDDTEEYMKEMEEKYPVCYYRNRENLGADGNLLECFQKASGKYLLILADDDILLPGSLKILFSLLKEEPSFLFLNCCGFEGVYKGRESCGKASKQIEADFVTEDVNRFMELIGIHITFISALCFKMELVRKNDNLNEHVKSNFNHAYIALKTWGMADNRKFMVSKEPLIAARGGNSGGYNLYETWFESYYKLIREGGLTAGVEKDVQDRLLYDSYKNAILGFVRIYRVQHDTMKLKNRNVVWKAMKHYPSLWFRTIFWVYTPGKLLLFLKKIKGRK